MGSRKCILESRSINVKNAFCVTFCKSIYKHSSRLKFIIGLICVLLRKHSLSRFELTGTQNTDSICISANCTAQLAA